MLLQPLKNGFNPAPGLALAGEMQYLKASLQAFGDDAEKLK